MKSTKSLYLLTVIIISILFYSGCGAGSSSTRYGNTETKESTDRGNARFTSEEKEEVNGAADSLSNQYYTDEEEEEDEDTLPEDEQQIDITEVMKRLSKTEQNTDPTSVSSNSKEKVLMEIIKYLNTPYKFGGNSMNGIDCSAFTQTIFSNSLSIPLNRTARDQFRQGIEIGREELMFGDLVFFNTRRRVRPGHVGIYIGDNLFAHSSSKQGVIVSSLEHAYYTRTYMGGRRIERSELNN